MNDRGYITIAGRLARFSKIAGEITPHALALRECKLTNLWIPR